MIAARAANGGKKIASACAPNSIVADGSTLFWLDACDGSIMSLANDGTNPSSIAAGQSRSATLAADATRLYWIVYTTDTTADIRSMDKTGGAVTALATNESSPDTTPGRLIVDDTNVYWTSTAGDLRSVSKQGGQPITFTSNERLSTPAIDDSYVYWSEGGALERQSKVDASVDTVVQDASNNTFTSDLLASHGRLYYRVVYGVGEGSFGLWSVDATPNAQPAPLPIEAHDVGRAPMVLFGDRLYWVQGGDIVSMRVDGSETHAEASLSEGEIATSIAVDASYVYWTDTRSAGAVMRARL